MYMYVQYMYVQYMCMYMYMYLYIHTFIYIYIVAVCDVLQAPPASITAGIAADNLVVAIFFITLFAIANQTPVDPTPAAPSLSEEARILKSTLHSAFV
jgi:hypothetical protein